MLGTGLLIPMVSKGEGGDVPPPSESLLLLVNDTDFLLLANGTDKLVLAS